MTNRLVAAGPLPLELAGGVGVGVDRHQAPPTERGVEEVVGWVLTLRTAVDLDRGAESGARCEHEVGVETGGCPTGADDLAAGAVAQHVDVG